MSSRMPCLLLAAVLVPMLAMLVACATDAERAAVVSAVHKGRVDTGIDAAPRRAMLQFEARKAGTRPFPLPFLDVKVGSETVRFLVDTTAAGHSIDATVARTAGLAPPVKGSSLTIEGWGALGDQAVTIADFPQAMRAHGIGGVIAPQLLAKALAPGQAIALDFVRGELRAQPRTAAWASAEELGLALTTSSGRFCADGTIALEATVDGEATKLAVDTSGARTFVMQGSKAGARVAARPATGRSVSTAGLVELAIDIHGSVPFTIGSWSSTGEIGTAVTEKDAACGTEGRLGMDVLSRCALAMTGQELVLGCRQPVAR
ncbi:MAG: hypothetical protein JWP97_1918 [Labilithrix sp.]|nr:hypothetical protein [Labilithrix sp.]